MTAQVRGVRGERPVGLGLALGVSVVLHLVLFALGTWVTLLPDVVHAARPAEPPALRFTFARPDAERETSEPNRGNVPLATPATLPSRAVVLRAAAAAAGANRTSPAAAAIPPATPKDRPREQAKKDASGSPARENPDAPQRLESTPAGAVSPGRGAPPTTVPDLSRALAEYRRSLQAARAEEPPGRPGNGPHDNVYVPDAGSIPVRGAPFGILEFSSRDYDWSDYASQIYWAILAAWYQRLYETAAEFEKWAHGSGEWILDHRARIRFTIERGGNVTGIVLDAGSGCPPLDQSALDALAEVVLPPLPADFPREQEEIRGTFLMRGEIPGLLPTLRQLKAQNVF